ncbi:MAG: 50S ribosomal protein L22 [Parcubacteria group bacterium]|nr:50S ribosomal protein L22 [Parcubacteria group bacterium]
MRAFLKNYRQSPRKVRVVANAIRGKRVPDALIALSVLPKRATTPLKKLLESAVANAKNTEGKNDMHALFVKDIQVNKGVTLKRSMPRAMGRATPINKRSSHITIVLGEKENNKKTKK